MVYLLFFSRQIIIHRFTASEIIVVPWGSSVDWTTWSFASSKQALASAIGFRLTHRGPVLGCLGGSLTLAHSHDARCQLCQGAALEESRSFDLSHTKWRHLLGLQKRGAWLSELGHPAKTDHSHTVQGLPKPWISIENLLWHPPSNLDFVRF